MKIEVRTDNTVRISGYVNVVGRDSRPLRDAQGIFIEQVVPGTFRKALSANKPVELRFDHRRVVGGTSDGTLTLQEDNIGLRAEAIIHDEEVAEKARKKELRGWSFGFVKTKDRWEGEDPRRRYLEELELREVSILDVTPAYIATSIETRGEEKKLLEHRSAAQIDEIEYRIEERKKETPQEPEKRIEEEAAILQFFKQKVAFLKTKGAKHGPEHEEVY